MLLKINSKFINIFKRNASRTLDPAIKKELVSINEKLAQPGKGILAADESPANIGKKLAAINTENTPENRRQFRELLFTTKDIGEEFNTQNSLYIKLFIEKYISGSILFDSTVYQKTSSGIVFPQYLASRGIVPGIKVDQGLEPLKGSKTAFQTKGLGDLSQRCAKYKKEGCHFTKWRCVFQIGDNSSGKFMGFKSNSETMARYASICQQNRLVPIVEPEVLPLGDHDIHVCQKVTEDVLSSIFRALHTHRVYLEGIILKSNMVTPGQSCKKPSSPEEIAHCTVTAFQRSVPPAVPIIFLLSGGQSEEEATIHLNAIAQHKGKKPWFITFCYGRALQASAFKAWQGKKANVEKGQQEFLNRAKANSAANLGKYSPSSVKGAAAKDKAKSNEVHDY